MNITALMRKWTVGERCVADLEIIYGNTAVVVPEGTLGTVVGTPDSVGGWLTTGLVRVKWDGIEGEHTTAADGVRPAVGRD